MSTLKVKFYSDPGHGWVAVKRQLLVDLGILDKRSEEHTSELQSH